MLRHSLVVVFSLVFLAASAAAQVAPIYTEVRKLTLDSGYVDNSSSGEQVVFSKVLEAEKVDWIRLYFKDCNLPQGSRIRLTSLEDKAVQYHDGRSLRDYGDSSCYFNGGLIRVELLAGPGTKASRVQVVHVEVGPTVQVQAPNSICGTTDDRVFSTDPRVGRLSNGCTGWLINKRVAVTAGHCQSSSGSTIVSFNVPKSTSNGTYVQSHPNDQYPNDTSSIRRISGGIGNDYAVMLLNRNSNTKLYPGEAQKQWFRLGEVPSSPTNQNIRITGYGTTTPRDERNGAQKTHVGPMYSISSTALRYRTDTTGGNSGSPIIHENTGRAIGVHTHGGCRSSGSTSYNSGTSVNVFRSVAQQLLSSSGVGLIQTFGSGCKGSAGTPALSASGVADIGQTLTFTVQNAPSFALGLLFVGTSNTSQGTIKLPRDLGQIGMSGCSQLVSMDTVLPMNIGSTVGTWSGRIPFNFALLGIKGYLQHAVEDKQTNAMGMVVSNGLLIEVGK